MTSLGQVIDPSNVRAQEECSNPDTYNNPSGNITWHSKTFAELSVGELYELLRLRAEIFVVEQDCTYQDCDDKDQASIHIYGTVNGEMVAYTRIIPVSESSYDTPSIDRVLTSSTIRGKGNGYELMMKAMECCKDNFGIGGITISAQEHLEGYYEKLGFLRASEPYLEDGILHIKMVTTE